MRKRGFSKRFLVLSAFLCVFLLGLVSAGTNTTLTQVNDTFYLVNITDANNLYGYEVNLNVTNGTISIVSPSTHNLFLGSAAVATYGSSLREGVYSVYGSRLDSNSQGISGNGTLFNFTASEGANVTMFYSLFIQNDTSETYVYFNGTTITGNVGEGSGITSGGGSSGGGGGGGGGVAVDAIDVIVVPDELTVDLIEGGESIRSLKIANNGQTEIRLLIEAEGIQNFVEVSDSITIQAGEQKSLDIKFKAPKKGLIVGSLVFKYGSEIIDEVPVTLNVRSENFLFDSSIVIPDRYKRVMPGQKIKAQVNLLQVGPAEKVDVTANYVIKDYKGNVFLEEHETFFVLVEKEFTKEFSTDKLPSGKYVLGLEIVYPGAFATSSTQFEVSTIGELPFPVQAIGFFGIMVLVTGLVVVWVFYKKRKVSHHVRKK